MTALWGKTLLFLGCFLLGLGKALTRKRRTACLRSLAGAAALAERELAFSLPTVPVLLARLRRQSSGPLREFFAACADAFHRAGEESLADSWEQTLEDSPLPLQGEDRALLLEMGRVLGRYDGDSQRRALAELYLRLNQAAARAGEEEARLFRVDVVLGAAAGAFCVLLL